MSISNAYIRAKSLYKTFHFSEPFYPVVNKKDLAATFGFIINDITNSVFIKYHHFGLYWLPVWRWCIDNAQITCPHQTELQGPRNRSSRKREGIHRSPQLFQFFFRCNTEFLFFINDHHSKIFEFYILA